MWYKVGNFEYLDLSNSTQIVLDIKQSPQGAYTTVEPSVGSDIMVTKSQIDSNANINIKVDAKGILKNFTDASKITKWELFFRKEPALADSQYQAFSYTLGLGLTQSSSKIFTVSAGVLAAAENYPQKFAVKAVATVDGKEIASTTEYCTVTLYKGVPPPPITGGNQPPVAVIAGPTTVKVGEGVIISGAAQKTITVVPPTPGASFNVTGKLKEKRIVYLNNTSSSPAKFPIVPEKTKWSIKSVPGTGDSDDAIKKVVKVSTIKEEVLVDPYTSGILDGIHSSIVSFNKAGEYVITLTVQNTAGYASTTIQRIKIVPDLEPIVAMKFPSKVYRLDKIDNTNYAKLTVTDESYSPDGDFIGYRKIYIVYDSNNNGSYEDAGDKTVTISESSDRDFIDKVKTFEYLSKDVGKYMFFMIIEESYIP